MFREWQLNKSATFNEETKLSQELDMNIITNVLEYVHI